MNNSFDKDPSSYGLAGSKAFIEECRQAWVNEDGELPVLSSEISNVLALLVLAVDALAEEAGSVWPILQDAPLALKRYWWIDHKLSLLIDEVFEAATFQMPFDKAAEQAAQAAE